MFLKVTTILLALLSPSLCHTFQTLLPEQNRLFSYEIKTNVSTGTISPIHDASYWTLEGVLTAQVYDDFGRIRLQLHDIKTIVNTKRGPSTDQSSDAVEYLTGPFEVDICFSTIHSGEEPVWVTNVKRALAFNFLVAEPNGSLKNVEEPCLYGNCVWVYSRVGNLTRKYCAGVARRPVTYQMTSRCAAPRVAEWRSRTPIDIDPNYLLTAERDYYLDTKIGLKTMQLRGEFQYKTHDHILSVMTDLSLTYKSSKPGEIIQKLNLTESPIQYEFHNVSNPSNGIWNTTQSKLKNTTYEMLLTIVRKGIDSDNIVRNASLIHSLDFINLLNTMSQLSYESLTQLFQDVLGTSYELETSRNIFLEVLPYVRNEAGARLVRHLIVDLKNRIEDSMLVSLIRKLPYSITTFSRPLLEELEVFTKLGPDFPQDIRHAAILSFATMMNIAMEADFDQQYFDDIYDKYLRMYNYCPQYIDRLVWLQGLANIGKNSVNYLDEIYTDTKKNRHERLWAALASISIWKGATLENTLPILMNDTEHIQLRVIALHAILTSPLGPRDFFNVHNYLKTCNNNQLKRFWYTTMKSLENNRFYDKYKSASYYIPFLAPQLNSPGSKEWATNNYIISQEPSLDIQGPTFQLLTVGGPWSGAPELVVTEFSTGGELAFNGAIYIVAEGVTSNVFRRIQTSEKTDQISQYILNILKEVKIEVVDPEKVHIDIIVKIYDKIVYATYIDQDKFDSWNAEELRKSIDDFVRFGSHINQQVVYYPTQMVKDFPTEIGTPVRLHSTIVTFTSIRGNLTAPSTDDLTWRNDLHIRYQGTAVTSVSIDGPLQPSKHTARLQQSMVVHLPMKFDVKLSPETRSFELKWTNPAQNGGVAMHSRTQIATASKNGRDVHTISTKRNRQMEQGIYFDCERPMTSSQISQHLTSRNYNIITSLQPSQILLNTIRLLTSPTSGSCGIILPPMQLPMGNKVDLTFKVDEWSDKPEEDEARFRVKISFGLDYYRGKGDNRNNYFISHGVVEIDSDGTNGTLHGAINVYQDHGNNFSVCWFGYHEVDSSFDIDFTDFPAEYIGGFTSYIAADCGPTHDRNKEQYRLEIRYKNKNQDTTDHHGRVFNVSVASDSSIFGLRKEVAESMLFLGYADNPYLRLLTTDNFDSGFDNSISIKVEDGENWVKWNDKQSEKAVSDVWLPPSMTAVQILKRLGFYHECRIDHSPLESGKQLVIGDCTNKPRFAIIKANCEDCTSNTHATTNSVVFTNKNISMTSYALDEFKKYVSDSEGRTANIIRSQLTGVLVYYTTDETVVLVPQAYMNTACGVCID